MNLNTGGWASPLLRLVARLLSDGLNSTTPVTEINGGNISATNADIALVAKGTGATLAQVPDGTVAGGDKRGQYATDWQKGRTVSTQIAAGLYSVLCGGYRNSAVGNRCAVVAGENNLSTGSFGFIGGGFNNTTSTGSAYHAVTGGLSNTASSDYSFVGGGQSNTAQTNTHAAVCGGTSNTASGAYSFVGSGASHVASGSTSTVSGGNTNTASGDTAIVAGGRQNLATGNFSFIGGGRRGSARSIDGYSVFPACNIPVADALGVSQSALLLLGRQTTTATATVLTSNTSAASTTNQVILPNNAAYYFRGSVIAGVTAGGDSKAWTFEGAIKRGANAASTAIVGTVVLNTIAQGAGASAWTVAITADTTNGGIAVTVTGALATTIRWVAKIETTEMTY